MVSFSCDLCQDVIKKPKILHHFSRCRTSTVSCVDCGISYNSKSVTQHIQCITEEEKHHGKSQSNTQSYCKTCSLSLSNPVHAEQHYTSKKHKSYTRKEQVKPNPTNPSCSATKNNTLITVNDENVNEIVKDLLKNSKSARKKDTSVQKLKVGKVVKALIKRNGEPYKRMDSNAKKIVKSTVKKEVTELMQRSKSYKITGKSFVLN
mmetsp:Transcript_6920/g.12397  ORF Transcript_6920/g.12397 Transcript_6920/m.12397 type:complete len:206 (+) Transcript_6920:56-673(+)